MAKTITFKYKDVPYVLEFTRQTVATLEQQGFNIREVGSKPMSSLPLLFAGAFLAHHKFVRRQLIDEIFDNITDKENLVIKLAEMYSETIESLMGEPTESEGNVKWGASW